MGYNVKVWLPLTYERADPVDQAVLQKSVSTAGKLNGKGQSWVKHGSRHPSTWTHTRAHTHT